MIATLIVIRRAEPPQVWAATLPLEVRGADTRIRCVAYSCSLAAGSCVRRQLLARVEPTMRSCGACAQGRAVAGALEAAGVRVEAPALPPWARR